jgi:hypothetical protein
LLARTVSRGRAAGSEKSRKFGRAAKTAIDAWLDQTHRSVDAD